MTNECRGKDNENRGKLHAIKKGDKIAKGIDSCDCCDQMCFVCIDSCFTDWITLNNFVGYLDLVRTFTSIYNLSL